MQFTYKTICQRGHAEFRDRGSRFIAFTYPINTTEEVKAILNDLKKDHPKAVHHCYAYRLGLDGILFRANDDGEPAGSAGKPILGQIDSAGITDALIVVVRYFGGTLLGVPGLINAYKTVAADALDQTGFIEKNIEEKYLLEFEYSIMNEVITVLKQSEATLYQQNMQLFCSFEAGIPLFNKDKALQRLSDIRGLEIKAVR